MKLSQDGFILKTKCGFYISIRNFTNILVPDPFKATFIEEMVQAQEFKDNYFEQWNEELEILPVYRTLDSI